MHLHMEFCLNVLDVFDFWFSVHTHLLINAGLHFLFIHVLGGWLQSPGLYIYFLMEFATVVIETRSRVEMACTLNVLIYNFIPELLIQLSPLFTLVHVQCRCYNDTTPHSGEFSSFKWAQCRIKKYHDSCYTIKVKD